MAGVALAFMNTHFAEGRPWCVRSEAHEYAHGDNLPTLLAMASSHTVVALPLPLLAAVAHVVAKSHRVITNAVVNVIVGRSAYRFACHGSVCAQDSEASVKHRRGGPCIA